jgi:hypothetical protein
MEIRRLLASRLELLTESGDFDLWQINLLEYLDQFGLSQHIQERISTIPGDEDMDKICRTASSIVRSSISSSLMKIMKRKYGTDPAGNAYDIIMDAKRAVTQVDIFSVSKLLKSMTRTNRQDFADTNSYLHFMQDLRTKLANTADDMKISDRFFVWLLLNGYEDTNRQLTDDLDNDVTRGAKTPSEAIRQLQQIGDREKAEMSVAAIRPAKRPRTEDNSQEPTTFTQWPVCDSCYGRKHPPDAHRCPTCQCFHTPSNPCAPQCGKKCGTVHHYGPCTSRMRFVCLADKLEFDKKQAGQSGIQHTIQPSNKPRAFAISSSVFNSSGQVETYGYGAGKAGKE